MERIGTRHVFLTGSKRTIERVIKTDGTKFFITWYGNLIEVKQGVNKFYTVDKY